MVVLSSAESSASSIWVSIALECMRQHAELPRGDPDTGEGAGHLGGQRKTGLVDQEHQVDVDRGGMRAGSRHGIHRSRDDLSVG